MKKRLSFIVLALGLLSTAAFATKMVKYRVPIDNIYVPFGFDSNDLSEVVVEGFLPDLCYTAPEVYLRRDGDNLKMKVVAYKEDNPNKACLRMKVPFHEVVNTGILDRGKYKIIGNPHSKFEKKAELKVAESVSGAVDDYIYARVEDIDFDGYKTVTLKGYNPSDCFALDKVEFVSNGVDTYSVLPILKQVKDNCMEKMTEFRYDVDLPDTINREKILLHVRAMKGKSINRLIRRK